MTLNDLIKQIPKEYHDSFIKIYIPILRDGDQGSYPLINVSLDQIDNESVEILLEADTV